MNSKFLCVGTGLESTMTSREHGIEDNEEVELEFDTVDVDRAIEMNSSADEL
jgi:hypothetical protein